MTIDDTISIKRNTTAGYNKESDYIKKSQSGQQENIGEISEISQDKLTPMHEKWAFTFHHNFYPKPKVKLEDVIISDETKDKLQVLKKNYNNIVSHHSSNIELTYLEEMVFEMLPFGAIYHLSSINSVPTYWPTCVLTYCPHIG